MHISSAALANTQRTIDSYEGCADEYSRIVDPFPSPSLEAALRQVATAAGKGGQILEIGSGAGWDADFLETQGVSVSEPMPRGGSWNCRRRAARRASSSMSSPTTSAAPMTRWSLSVSSYMCRVTRPAQSWKRSSLRYAREASSWCRCGMGMERRAAPTICPTGAGTTSRRASRERAWLLNGTHTG